MDRYSEKKDGRGFSIISMAVVFSGIFIILFFSDIIFAEVTKEKEKKIELEKEEIYGVLEKPNVLFPMRWKSPEGPAENVYTLERSFREEIFDFVDEERMRKGFEGSRVQGVKGK